MNVPASLVPTGVVWARFLRPATSEGIRARSTGIALVAMADGLKPTCYIESLITFFSIVVVNYAEGELHHILHIIEQCH